MIAFAGRADRGSTVVSYLLAVQALVIFAVANACYCMFAGANRVVVLRVVRPAAYETLYRVSP
jgi:hypothetical protein